MEAHQDTRYYLREDFNPEPISSMKLNKVTDRFIEEMEQAGNIFNSREEAEKASKEIKAFLKASSCNSICIIKKVVRCNRESQVMQIFFLGILVYEKVLIEATL